MTSLDAFRLLNPSLSTSVSLLALYGMRTAFREHSARMHSFNANRLLLILDVSTRWSRSCSFESNARSLPARSTNVSLPTQGSVLSGRRRPWLSSTADEASGTGRRYTWHMQCDRDDSASVVAIRERSERNDNRGSEASEQTRFEMRRTGGGAAGEHGWYYEDRTNARGGPTSRTCG